MSVSSMGMVLACPCLALEAQIFQACPLATTLDKWFGHPHDLNLRANGWMETNAIWIMFISHRSIKVIGKYV